jgi:hypothetical protein
MATSQRQASDGDGEIVAFARSAIGGKKTAEIKARTSDELKFTLQRRCHELGMTESEYIDRLVALSLFGEEHVLSVDREKTKGVAGLCPRGGLGVAP